MQSDPVADLHSNPSNEYALGYTVNEHDRLIRQAERIAPVTERLFREAGIGPGDRVLDLGSGLGDVSMLLARLVGSSGRVVGVERDTSSIERARGRVARAGFDNVVFVQTDVNDLGKDDLFDAAVGRFILMFLPDPEAVLRSVALLVRPGGVLALQEPTWIPFLAFNANLPLWSKVLHTIHETLLRQGVNPEMGPDLYPLLRRIGLPAPRMREETLLGADPELTGLLSDLLISLRPLAEYHQVNLDGLGDLSTLSERVQEEVKASNRVVSFVPLVGVWARIPDRDLSGFDGRHPG